MKIRVHMDITFPATEDSVGDVVAAGDHEVGVSVTEDQADVMLGEPRWATLVDEKPEKKPKKPAKDA